MSIHMVRKGFGYFGSLTIALALSLLVVGCRSHSPQVTPSREQPRAATADYEIIRPGDTLTVAFTDLPTLMAPVDENVKEDGTITLIHNQTFKCAGRTVGEIEKEVRARYVPDFYQNMTVSVKHLSSTRFYYVGGEVKLPGRQVYLGPITVSKAIQTAGDFTDFAKKTAVKLTRVNGSVQTINCKKALVDPKLDPEVSPGDKITVPRRIWW
jgi:polysaccharide export outer membrane protein